MSTPEVKQNSSLLPILSILGVISIALFAGLLLMQRMNGQKMNIVDAMRLQSNENSSGEKEFDPITWAREEASYPPLEKETKDEVVELKTDFDSADALPDEEEIAKPVTPAVTVKSADKLVADPVAKPAPVMKNQTKIQSTKTVAAEKVPAKSVRKNSFPKKVQYYWVQVFSTLDQSSAEAMREALNIKGMPALVQVRNVKDSLYYRVRLGPYSHKSEADYYAGIVRKISGFESSYVVLYPITYME